MVDLERLGTLALDRLVVGLAGILDAPQPRGDLAVGAAHAQPLAADTRGLALQRRLDVAHGDGQHAALFCLEDAEIGRELNERRGFVELHL